jgi:hypothetical protein
LKEGGDDALVETFRAKEGTAEGIVSLSVPEESDVSETENSDEGTGEVVRAGAKIP